MLKIQSETCLPLDASAAPLHGLRHPQLRACGSNWDPEQPGFDFMDDKAVPWGKKSL